MRLITCEYGTIHTVHVHVGIYGCHCMLIRPRAGHVASTDRSHKSEVMGMGGWHPQMRQEGKYNREGALAISAPRY